MSNTVSKAIADRVAINNTVISAINTHGPEFIPKLEQELFPNGLPATLNTEGFVFAFRDLLVRQNQTLIQVDLTHAGELSDDDQYRIVRDEATATLRQLASIVRANLHSGYGLGIASAYGMKEAMPEDLLTLVAYAQNAAKLLASRPLSEPCKFSSMAVNAPAASADLYAASAALKTALEDVERERREAQVTLSAKNQALAGWPSRYQDVANATMAFCGIGGRADLAERVKPTTRRRAGLPEDEDLAGAGDNEPPSGTPEGGQTGNG